MAANRKRDQTVKGENVEKPVDLPTEVTLSPSESPGVLVSSEIIDCVKKYNMISPFYPEKEKDRLKPAAYHLSIGKECRVGEKTVFLDEKTPYLRIKPYQVAIVETLEELNMPRNVIGRWNLRISCVYDGLLWVGGPQVDPGYKGHLYCPIYNLSTKSAILEYGQPFATIDFVRTTPGRSVSYSPRRHRMADYPILKSAPKETLDRVRMATRRMQVFETTVITTIGIIIAALAIIATSNVVPSTATLLIAVGAIVTFVTGFLIGLLSRKSG
jgi:deoxycytidine triphosphate deaminase